MTVPAAAQELGGRLPSAGAQLIRRSRRCALRPTFSQANIPQVPEVEYLPPKPVPATTPEYAKGEILS